MSGLKQNKWSHEATSHVIELYSGERCLYDLTSPDYHNRNKRNFSLEVIASGMHPIRPGTTTAEVKLKLNGLRTQFLDALNKIKTSKLSGTSADAIHVPTLWCFEMLRFLEPFTVHHKGMDNLGAQINALEDLNTTLTPPCADEVEVYSTNFNFGLASELGLQDTACLAACPSSLNSSTPQNSSTASDSSTPAQNLKTTTIEKMSKKRRQTHQKENSIDTLLDHANHTLSSIRDRAVVPDAIDIYCQYLGSELRQIKSLEILKQLKRKLNAAVVDAQDMDDLLQ